MTEVALLGPIELDLRTELQHRPQPTDNLRPIVIGSTTDKVSYIADNLPKPMEDELTQLLVFNVDLFAWILADTPGIDPEFACHSLVVDPFVKPVSQKKRKLGEDKRQ